MSFDPRPICEALNDEGVRYVVIGGFAATIHGSPLPTADVDLVPDREADNLERLARALVRIGARLRTEAGPVDTRIDGAFLRAMPFMLNLTTDHGDVDLTFQPAGAQAGLRRVGRRRGGGGDRPRPAGSDGVTSCRDRLEAGGRSTQGSRGIALPRVTR